MRDIGEREGWARLRAGGLAVTAKGGLRAILADHLCRSHAGCRWAIASATGNIASSVYGDPNALKLTWYFTALGLVNEAAAHNDGFMPLDEIGQGSNRKAVADAAYALFNGVGKIQGAREGGNRELKRWRAMAFSTGEINLESYIRADGGRVNAGQLVRLLNVPITKATVFHGYQDGKAHADAIRDASNAHYGAVGRAWIAHLASQKENALATYRETERRWLSLLPDDASEQVRRVTHCAVRKCAKRN